MNRSLLNRIFVVLLCSTPLFASCDVPIDFWMDKSTTVALMTGMPTMVAQTPPPINLKADYPQYFQEASIIKTIAIPELWIEVQNLQTGNAATQVAGSITISDPSDTTFTPITIAYGTAVDANGIPVDSNGVDLPGAVSICSTPFTANGVLTCGVPIVEGGRLDLTPPAAEVSSLQAQIQKTGNIAITYNGAIDALPALFDLQGEIHLVATVTVPDTGS